MRICPQCGAPHTTRGWDCRCGYAAAMAAGIPLLAPQLAQGTGEDAAYRHSDLSDAESRHFWFVGRSRLIAWALAAYFPGARSFLDVGCGTGGVERAIHDQHPTLRIVASDVLLAGLTIAHARVPRVEFVQLDIRAMPYEAEFDVAGAFDVIEHLDDDGQVLREMHRVTVPGGGVIVTVPQHRWLWSAVDEFSQHRRRYSRAELAERLGAAGFRVERITSFMTFVLPLLALARLRKQKVAELDPAAELALGPVANALLGAMCYLEATLIRFGLSFPVGGSLLAIARRADS